MTCCKDCRFCETERDSDPSIGDCKRYPPAFNNKATRKNGEEVSLSCIVPEWWCNAWWPIVKLDDWCGEWKAKPELETKPEPEPERIGITRHYESSGHLSCTFQVPFHKMMKVLDLAGVQPAITMNQVPYYDPDEAYGVLRDMKPTAKKAVPKKPEAPPVKRKRKTAKKKPPARKTKK